MKLYNTLSRSLEEVRPQEENTLKLYTCGLTVYSQPHIGNWVAYIYWDILVRALRASGYKVTRVQNITDVGHLTSDEDAGEDKMLKGALREGLSAWQVAEKYMHIADTEAYTELGLVRPDHMPRATQYIPQQIAFVTELEKKGFTYTIQDGVYFDTSKLKDYGKLARLDIDGLQFGARVADTGKKNPTDFALWKFSPAGEKRDMEWDSPWGKGFPGWHLECSVMARELLGDTIDIHTGGIDHIPVHHTNEIAQSEALTGKVFAHTWVHANHLKVDGTKISKSLGNGYTLSDVLERGFTADAFKILVLSKHYRTEGNFTWEILEAAAQRLKGFEAFADLKYQDSPDAGTLGKDYFAQQYQRLLDAVCDDLKTPEALAIINDTIDHIERHGGGVHTMHVDDMQTFLTKIDNLLGLHLSQRSDISAAEKDLIKERMRARQDKNWQESDRLRTELEKKRIGIRDTVHGTTWYRL